MPILPGDKNRDHGSERTNPTAATQKRDTDKSVGLSNDPAPQQTKALAQPIENNVTVAASMPKIIQRRDMDTKSLEEFVDAKD